MITWIKCACCSLRSTFLTVSVSLLALFALSACEGLRLHDQGRLKTATEARTLAEEFSSEGVVVFGPLEKRQDAVSGLSEEIIDLAVKHEFETFKLVLPDQNAEEIGDELLDTMLDWRNALEEFDQAETQAVQAVNEALHRRQAVNLVLTTSLPELQGKLEQQNNKKAALDAEIQELTTDLEPQGKKCEDDDRCKGLSVEAGKIGKRIAELQSQIDIVTKALPNAESEVGSSLQDTLDTLKNRIVWIDQRADKFLSAFDKASGLAKENVLSADSAEVLSDIGDDATEAAARLNKFFDATETALKSIDSDEQVVAARALLAMTIRDQLDLELARLNEYRRYLGAVRRLRETINTRDIVAVCELFANAFYRVWPASRSENLLDLYNEFAWEPRYKGEAGCQLPAIVPKDDGNGSTQSYLLVLLEGVDDLKRLEKLKTTPARCFDSEVTCIDLPGSLDAEDWVSDGEEVTLAQYLASNVKREAENAQGPQLVAALGILIFVERPFLDIAVNRLYEENNRHVLRLSKINSQQRASLLTELAQ